MREILSSVESQLGDFGAVPGNRPTGWPLFIFRNTEEIMARDIVCDMAVDEQTASDKKLVMQYKGQTYYFCSPECKQAFDIDPQHYTREKPPQLYAGATVPPIPSAGSQPPSTAP
jgi:YHS domain-containing protein